VRTISNDTEKYNQIELEKAWIKLWNGTFTQNDAIEMLANAIIDATIFNVDEREKAKAIISVTKKIVEKMDKK